MSAPATGNGWLTGKTALITGGGSGIGLAVAKRFIQEGATVAIVGRGMDRLQEAANSIGTEDQVLPLVGDVRNPQDMTDVVAATVERFGKLDILVPNAGIWDYNRSVTAVDGEQLAAAFDELFAINVKGYLLAVNAAWPELVKTRGNVVMTLSNASFHTAGGGPVYTASKFACRGLVNQLAYELAPKVRVNGVAVGGMKTDLRGPESMGLKDRTISDSFARQTTVGDNPYLPLHDASVEPEDYTGPYVLLASDQNSSVITGAIIPADGGIAVRGFRTAAGGDQL